MAKEKEKVKKTVTMAIDKVCKSCVRCRAEGAEGETVSSSIYIQNATYEALGKLKKFKITVEAAS